MEFCSSCSLTFSKTRMKSEVLFYNSDMEVTYPVLSLGGQNTILKTLVNGVDDTLEHFLCFAFSLPIGMIQRLYAGLQCTSCGQRFHLKDGEKTEEYRQHLDWHFRQNRKEKADTKVANCRKWYYGINVRE